MPTLPKVGLDPLTGRECRKQGIAVVHQRNIISGPLNFAVRLVDEKSLELTYKSHLHPYLMTRNNSLILSLMSLVNKNLREYA